jgi:hypothetical protein
MFKTYKTQNNAAKSFEYLGDRKRRPAKAVYVITPGNISIDIDVRGITVSVSAAEPLSVMFYLTTGAGKFLANHLDDSEKLDLHILCTRLTEWEKTYTKRGA